jgi:hypothetical protein
MMRSKGSTAKIAPPPSMNAVGLQRPTREGSSDPDLVGSDMAMTIPSRALFAAALAILNSRRRLLKRPVKAHRDL